MIKSIFKFLSTTVLIAFACCTPTETKKADTNKTESDTTLVIDNLTDTVVVDSNQLDKALLTRIYIKAIEKYIEAIHKKDNTSFDTLFFGKRKFGQPDDFPDIILPEKINNTRIVLLSIPEAHSKIMKLYKKNSPMINLMGWVDKVKAEFAFITFYPEFNHQYDCYINYNFNSENNDYELEKLTIEVLIMDKKGNPDHFAIFQNGKYIGDKTINNNKK